MRMRRLGFVAATALAASATVACMPLPVVCTTVGYASVLTVTPAEPRPDISLELCVTEGCTPRAFDEAPSDQPIEVCETEECITGAPEEPAASADDGIWQIESGDGRDGWTVSIFSGGTVVAYRLLDADGALLAEGEVEPDWVRVGGSEQCGGPAEAEVVLG